MVEERKIGIWRDILLFLKNSSPFKIFIYHLFQILLMTIDTSQFINKIFKLLENYDKIILKSLHCLSSNLKVTHIIFPKPEKLVNFKTFRFEKDIARNIQLWYLKIYFRHSEAVFVNILLTFCYHIQQFSFIHVKSYTFVYSFNLKILMLLIEIIKLDLEDVLFSMIQKKLPCAIFYPLTSK